MNDIIVDVIKDTGNKIIVSQNDNLTKTYKLIVTKNNARYDLSNKKVRFAFLKNGTNLGDIVEELNISDAANGVIDFPITSTITRESGTFTCGLAIFNDSGYMENTAFFNMLVKESIFEKISGGLVDEGVYGQILSLLEKGEKLQKKLEPLVDKAEIVTPKLEDLVPRAEAITQPLQDAVEDAKTKKSQLDASIESAKEFINGLDGSQNIPQIRMDLNELQNGLKTNQELAYEGANLKCENTLDGRIEDIVLEGMTYQNLFEKNFVGNEISTSSGGGVVIGNILNLKPYTTYTIIYKIKATNNINITNPMAMFRVELKASTSNQILYGFKGDLTTRYKYVAGTFTTRSDIEYYKCVLRNAFTDFGLSSNTLSVKNIIVLEGDYTDKFIPSYFEGIKSVGEAEENKVNVLSCSKNLFNIKNINSNNNTTVEYIENGYILTGNGDWKSLSYNFNLVPNKKYYLKFNRKWLEGDKGTSLVIKDDGHNIVDDNQENGKYGLSEYSFTPKTGNITIIIFSSRANTSKTEVTNIILSESNIQYEPHREDKRELKLPFEGGLKGLSNGVKDLIYNKDDGCYVLQKIGKRTAIGNGTNDYYELDTPIETKLSDTKLSLDTYSGLTYVFSNNTISPNIKLKVASNLGSIIQQNAKSINDIYKLIDEVIIPQLTTNSADIQVLKIK